MFFNMFKINQKGMILGKTMKVIAYLGTFQYIGINHKNTVKNLKNSNYLSL